MNYLDYINNLVFIHELNLNLFSIIIKDKSLEKVIITKTSLLY